MTRTSDQTKDASEGHDYLFTWAPGHWPLEDLVRFVREFKLRGEVEEPWTCAAHKKIQPGDRAYLLKQHKPVGIFGRGRVVGEAVRRTENERGRGQWEVPLRFDESRGDVLCDPLEGFLVDEEQLFRIPVPRTQWRRQAAGTSLAEKAARAIDDRIAGAGSVAAWMLQKDIGNAVVEVADQIKLSRGGQGFLMSPRVRRAIELHAVGLAKQHYEQKGYSVKVKGKPYDLLCTSEGRGTIYVEVKGTQGSGLEVLLTPNEVMHARAHKDQVALFVVSGITVSSDESGIPSAQGGEKAIYEPWDIDCGDLQPLGYSLTITKRTS